jgi:hypothetical protein
MGQLLVESEATHVRTITKPELIPDPLQIHLALGVLDASEST